MLAGLFVALDVPLTRVMLQLRVVEVERIVTAGSDGFGEVPRMLGAATAWDDPHQSLTLAGQRTDDSDAQRLTPQQWDRTWPLTGSECHRIRICWPHVWPHQMFESFESSPLTWSPLTESNRRPSPYHGSCLWLV